MTPDDRACDRHQLFREAHRVLQPEGLVYIKDVFRPMGPLRGGQWQELHAFDQLYAQRTPTVEETISALRLAGFKKVEVTALNVSMDHFHKALGRNGQPTSFGKAHPHTFRQLPVFFADVVAFRD